MMNDRLERAWQRVQKPARYTGGELHSVVKDPAEVRLRFGFCFPDLYEIGMSHLGMKILYSLLNERPDWWCERVFMPDLDMIAQMKALQIPLYGLESLSPVGRFDMLGFTLQYEMSYTNILAMLELAGLPALREERSENDPVVIGGGPCACNPEPLADFFDLFLLGEAEESLPELCDVYLACKDEGLPKADFLRKAAAIRGVYVPSLYEIAYHPDGTVESITPTHGAPMPVHKRTVVGLSDVYFPGSFVLPAIGVVHDRAMVEVLRGCIRGCRFCQAGFIYRPFREKSVDSLLRDAKSLCESTGYDEISLTSLSTGDHKELPSLLEHLIDWTEPRHINMALPSLRLDSFSPEWLEKVQAVRKSGLTFAPEAGTQRLRDVINKNLSEEEILSACRDAFQSGHTSVKLYFMIGLPTETDDDVRGIIELAGRVVDEFYAMETRPKGQSVSVTVSVASFVPKPFTPFQYDPQDTREMLEHKQRILRETKRSRKVQIKYHDAGTSFLEAVFARGDRRLARVILDAYRRGCFMDSWDEHFQYDTWLQCFRDAGLDPEFYACRMRSYDEITPWSHLDYDVGEAFLKREHRLSREAATTPDCRTSCAHCGAARLKGGVCLEHR